MVCGNCVSPRKTDREDARCEFAFETLQTLLMESPVFKLLDVMQTLSLHTDASGLGLGQKSVGIFFMVTECAREELWNSRAIGSSDHIGCEKEPTLLARTPFQTCNGSTFALQPQED